MPAFRLVLLALVLSGCVYDLYDDDPPYRLDFQIDDVVGTYAGTRTLSQDGQTLVERPVTATVSVRDPYYDGGTVDIAIDTEGQRTLYTGSYGSYGITISGYESGTDLQLAVDAEGFITGYVTVGGNFRELTGRLTTEHFDLFEREPGGGLRDDVRTTQS